MKHWTAPSIVVLSAIIILLPVSALSLTKADYNRIDVSLPADALVPADVSFVDEQGQQRQLGEVLTKPTILLPADLTCRTLCGPTLDYLISVLGQTGLQAHEQYRVLVVSFAPDNSADDAQALRDKSVIQDTSLADAVTFARLSTRDRDRLMTSLGYSYVFDESSNQYVHPEAAFILRADGHVSRVLNGIGFSGDDLRLALVEAGNGRIGTVQDKIRLICSAFDPATGTYSLLVHRVLELSAVFAVVILFAGLSALFWMERSARRSE